MPGLNVATPEKPPFSASKWTAKKIPTRERLIFALDTTDFGEAKRIVEMLGDLNRRCAKMAFLVQNDRPLFRPG